MVPLPALFLILLVARILRCGKPACAQKGHSFSLCPSPRRHRERFSVAAAASRFPPDSLGFFLDSPHTRRGPIRPRRRRLPHSRGPATAQSDRQPAMRSQLWLLAVASGRLATATGWVGQELDHRGGGGVQLLPRQTQASAHDGADGFTPKPTDGPSLELAKRRQDWALMRRQTANTWVDDSTCGWRADSACECKTCSIPWGCC